MTEFIDRNHPIQEIKIMNSEENPQVESSSMLRKSIPDILGYAGIIFAVLGFWMMTLIWPGRDIKNLSKIGLEEMKAGLAFPALSILFAMMSLALYLRNTSPRSRFVGSSGSVVVASEVGAAVSLAAICLLFRAYL